MPRLPEDNLDYPVFIQHTKGKGSGFLLNCREHTYLVTAKHVLYDERGALRNSTVTLTVYRQRFTHKFVFVADLDELRRNGHLRSHDTADVAVLVISRAGPNRNMTSTVNGVRLTVRPADDTIPVVGVSEDSIRRFADVRLSNEVFIFGYPVSIGERTSGQPNGKPDQLEPDKPLISKGVVAGLNMATQSIVLDVPLFPGNSGGLAVEVEEGVEEGQQAVFIRTIGVLTEFVPFFQRIISREYPTIENRSVENSGYSIVQPMDRVLEILLPP